MDAGDGARLNAALEELAGDPAHALPEEPPDELPDATPVPDGDGDPDGDCDANDANDANDAVEPVDPVRSCVGVTTNGVSGGARNGAGLVEGARSGVGALDDAGTEEPPPPAAPLDGDADGADVAVLVGAALLGAVEVGAPEVGALVGCGVADDDAVGSGAAEVAPAPAVALDVAVGSAVGWALGSADGSAEAAGEAAAAEGDSAGAALGCDVVVAATGVALSPLVADDVVVPLVPSAAGAAEEALVLVVTPSLDGMLASETTVVSASSAKAVDWTASTPRPVRPRTPRARALRTATLLTRRVRGGGSWRVSRRDLRC